MRDRGLVAAVVVAVVSLVVAVAAGADKPRVDMDARLQYYRQRVKAEACIPTPPPPDAPPLPVVPDSFMTEVEICLQGDERVVKGMETYDSIRERGVIDYTLGAGVVWTRPSVLSEVIHYNIPLDEALFIITSEGCSVTGQENCYSTKACAAKKIEDVSTELQEMFGIYAMAGIGGAMGAVGILQFGPQFNYTHIERQECRGMDCDVFETCLNKPELDLSLLYTYYWSTDDWNMHNNGQPVPVAVEVYGSGVFDGHTSREVMVRYDFLNFRREFRPSIYELEPPKDTYCHGRKTYLSPPRSVPSFSYRSEHINGVNIPIPSGDNDTSLLRFRGVYPQDNWYDWETRVSRVDYLPRLVLGNQRRFENWTSRVHDFNQGLAYVMKPRLNFCNITKIENTTTIGSITVGEDGSVFMTSPWNFEDLDEAVQYNGLHMERGMETDVWVGIKKNKLLGINETYVWYFASPLTHDILGRDGKEIPTLPTIDSVPIKLEKYITTLEGLPHVLFHIYNYDARLPHAHTHDVSSCFKPSQMRHFRFQLPANSLNKTFYQRESVKYAAMEALAASAKVSPVRINRVELEERPNSISVLFTVLEKPEVVGDVVGAGQGSSMDRAVELIRSDIDHSQLVVMVKVYLGLGELAFMQTLVALPGTMKEVDRSDGTPRGHETLVGYSPGDMAGLAIGMIVLGGLVGFAAIYFYSNKK